MRGRAIGALAGAWLVTTGANEVFADALADKFGSKIPDSAVEATTTLALKTIDQAYCSKDKLCAPTTPEELENPPISLADGRAAIGQGMVSAVAEHCGLDWQTRSFLPMTAQHRRELRTEERTITLLVLMHGITQGHQLSSLAGQGPCSETLRAQLDLILPKP